MAAKKDTKTSDKVMSMVEKELAENPDASVDELYEKAKKVDKSIAELTKRQFHARYPLQVKRRRSRSKPRRKKKRTTTRSQQKGRAKGGAKKSTASRASSAEVGGADGREAVREVFLNFASDLAAAEARKDLVKVLAGVDTYVADAIEAAKKG